jgi:ribosomal protein S14
VTFEQEKTTVHGLCVVFSQSRSIFKKIKTECDKSGSSAIQLSHSVLYSFIKLLGICRNQFHDFADSVILLA